MTIECPKCGAALRRDGSGWREEGVERCIDLAGTSYMNFGNNASGLSWCPTLAAAAPRDVRLQGRGYRSDVIKKIKEETGREVSL